jgi:hypothetical protein
MNVRMAILQHVISISAMRGSGSRLIDVQTVEVESTISITVERASGPMLTDVRTGYHIVQTVESVFPNLNFGKNLKLVEY